MPFGPSNGFWRLWTRWSKDSDAFCHSLSDPGRKLSGEHRNSLSPCATQIVVEPPWQKPCCVSCLPVRNKLTYLIVPWVRLWLAKQSPANRRVIVGKQQAQTSRRGENRASVLSVLKKCRFRHSETADSFPKMVCGFQTMICNLQGICAWKLARFFFHSHCHTILQGLTCDLHQTFGRGVYPTPLPHPDASHQLWVNMAVGCARDAS